jgi:hypothetical protein
MCLRTLHDRVRRLGLGAMFEKHSRSGFRDLLDNGSDAWAATPIPQKVIDLKAFASAGVSAEELIVNYRETMTQDGKTDVLDSLPDTMFAYRQAGYWPPLPDDLDARVDGPTQVGSSHPPIP